MYVAAVLLFTAAAALGIFCGSVKLSFSEVMSTLFGADGGTSGRIVRYVRLPRTLASLIAGAALAVSGAVIQSVFSNRLASPGIIGVNAGAGLAVTLCCFFGIYGTWQMSALAFAGALASAVLVCTGAKKWGASKGTVILLGVAMNSVLNAASDVLIALKPELSVMSGDFKIGDFSGVTSQKVIPAALICTVAFVLLMLMTNELELLKLGDECAAGLGLRVNFYRYVFLTLAAVLAGCAVSLAGLLSFVGLVVPNAVRGLGVTKSTHVIPLCALFGGGFVTLSDTAARCLFAPYEIPVGIIMAFVGAPIFVYILVRRKGGVSYDRA